MIISYGECDDIEGNVFVVKSHRRTLLRDNVKNNKDKKDYIGKIVDYTVDEINEEKKLILGRIEYTKSTMESIKDKSNFLLKGTIHKILDWGAFITVNGVQGKILNKDVFLDNTRIFEVFNEGDVIENLLLKENKFSLHVELIKKINGPRKNIKREDLLKGKEFEGTIRTIMPTACFVYILNERDVICSIPDQLEEDIERGSKVIVKLTTVSDVVNGNEKLRGKIVRIVEE
ncbi:MAG: hypothetical protein ACRDD7_16505 [Peptostreptococcaceae bacterium]